jgi:hypothetical protein
MRMVRWKVAGPRGEIYTDAFDLDNMPEGKEPDHVAKQRRDAAVELSNGVMVEVSFNMVKADAP